MDRTKNKLKFFQKLDENFRFVMRSRKMLPVLEKWILSFPQN